MYSLILLPRKTLKMIEQLICECLKKKKKTKKKPGLKNARVELPRKEGLGPIPFCSEESSWPGSEQHQEVWVTAARAKSCCCVEGPDGKAPH